MMRRLDRIGISDALRGLAAYVEEDFRGWERADKAPGVAAQSAAGVIGLMPTSDGAIRYPLHLSGMTLPTALRMAVARAVVAKHLAPRCPRSMALIGKAAQSEFRALAMQAIRGITRMVNPDDLSDFFGMFQRSEEAAA